MTLYGMWSGGVMTCGAPTRAGRPCRNKGYTINRAYGYQCPHHRVDRS